MINYSFITNGIWNRIKGRGFVVVIPREQIPEGMWDPGVLTGRCVEIDGEEFLVRGIEMFMPMISPEEPYKFDFGILV